MLGSLIGIRFSQEALQVCLIGPSSMATMLG